jgi:hypothetical protein
VFWWPNESKLSYDHWRGQARNGDSGPTPVGVSCSALLGVERPLHEAMRMAK